MQVSVQQHCEEPCNKLRWSHSLFYILGDSDYSTIVAHPYLLRGLILKYGNIFGI